MKTKLSVWLVLLVIALIIGLGLAFCSGSAQAADTNPFPQTAEGAAEQFGTAGQRSAQADQWSICDEPQPDAMIQCWVLKLGSVTKIVVPAWATLFNSSGATNGPLQSDEGSAAIRPNWSYQPTETATPEPTTTATITATATVTTTTQPTETPQPTPSETPIPTEEPTQTATPEPTATSTPTATLPPGCKILNPEFPDQITCTPTETVTPIPQNPALKEFPQDAEAAANAFGVEGTRSAEADLWLPCDKWEPGQYVQCWQLADGPATLLSIPKGAWYQGWDGSQSIPDTVGPTTTKKVVTASIRPQWSDIPKPAVYLPMITH